MAKRMQAMIETKHAGAHWKSREGGVWFDIKRGTPSVPPAHEPQKGFSGFTHLMGVKFEMTSCTTTA